MSPKADDPIRWWVLGFSLPMQPAYTRVKIWRHLQSIGALALGKNGVYVLPALDNLLAGFEWTLTEARAIGGDAVIFGATLIAGYDSDELRRLFQSERDSEYGSLGQEILELTAVLSRCRGAPAAAEASSSIGRLTERARSIGARDYFNAPARAEVLSLLKLAEARLDEMS
jgi:predicted trehalose synthase